MKRKRAGMKERFIKKTVLGLIILGLSFLLLFLAKEITGFAEWYANNVYVLLTDSLGLLAGLLPFSVSELILYVLGVCLVVGIIALPIRLALHKADRWAAANFAGNIIFGTGVLLLLYTLGCGINYNRDAFAPGAGILPTDYTEEELKHLCMLLTEEMNTLCRAVPRDGNGSVLLNGTEGALAAAAMAAAGEEFAALKGTYPQVKGVLISEMLSMQRITGIYSPFTVEANYNPEIAAYNIPFTMCHELAHFKGFMSEEEANFIAYLACMESDSVVFQYSGSLLAWKYSMKTLYQEDRAAYLEIWDATADIVKADIKENDTFWRKYEGTVAKVAEKVNDNYLKLNGQHDGVKSYDRMVDLLIAYGKRSV